jgi:hypothetical protein
VIRGNLVWLQWQKQDWCAHKWSPYWSNTLISSNPVFGFWVLCKAHLLVMWRFRHILTLSIQFFVSKRTDWVTPDSGISTSATTWHSFSFFPYSVHILRCSIVLHAVFNHKNKKRTYHIGSWNCHITVMHVPRLSFCAPCGYLIIKTKETASHRIMESPLPNLGMFMVCL